MFYKYDIVTFPCVSQGHQGKLFNVNVNDGLEECKGVMEGPESYEVDACITCPVKGGTLLRYR